MKDITIRNIEEIKKRFNAISSNLPLVFDAEGRARLIVELNVLDSYIKNPKINLQSAIEKNKGEVQRTYMWIGGLLT